MPSYSIATGHHLLITTQQQIVAWDSEGQAPLFTSNIVRTAKRTSDGRLAVADGSAVTILQNVGKEKDRGYQLPKSDGTLRLLELSNDEDTLFFGSSLQHAIQCYAIKQGTLLEPLHSLQSPPTVLAVSANSRLIVTACENPTTIYVQNIALRTPPQLLQPRASSSAVDVAAFHPDRHNVFMLGFRNGTVACYDATRLPTARGVKNGRQTGELGSLQNLHVALARLHESTSSEKRVATITGASFISGFQSRAITVGRDGKARVIDFDQGGKILRTWHVKAPATCLSVLATKVAVHKAGSPSKGKSRAAGRASPTRPVTQTEHTFAIGRQDGKVLIFNSLGLLLKEKTIDPRGRPILDISWCSERGNPVSTIQQSPIDTQPEEILDMPSKALAQATSLAPQDTSSHPPSTRTIRDRTKLDLSSFDPWPSIEPPSPPSTHLRPSTTTSGLSTSVYATPLEDPPPTSTINHTPLKHGPSASNVPAANFMDLFSPLKQPAPTAVSSGGAVSPNRKNTRARVRPRLRSSTFEYKGSPEPPASEMLNASRTPSPAKKGSNLAGRSDEASPSAKVADGGQRDGSGSFKSISKRLNGSVRGPTTSAIRYAAEAYNSSNTSKASAQDEDNTIRGFDVIRQSSRDVNGSRTAYSRVDEATDWETTDGEGDDGSVHDRKWRPVARVEEPRTKRSPKKSVRRNIVGNDGTWDEGPCSGCQGLKAEMQDMRARIEDLDRELRSVMEVVRERM